MKQRCENPSCTRWFTDPNRGKAGRPRKYCCDECRVHMLRTVFQPAYTRRVKRKYLERWGSW